LFYGLGCYCWTAHESLVYFDQIKSSILMMITIISGYYYVVVSLWLFIAFSWRCVSKLWRVSQLKKGR
jgi:hypothetical protein